MDNITKYVENKNFHTTLINFIFQFKIDTSEIMAYTLLAKLLSYTNEVFQNEKDFAREKLLRYIMNYNCLNQSINDVYFMNFSLLIPSNNVVKDDFIGRAITFLLDSIYRPNIQNGLFNQELFEREKRIYIENLVNGYKDISFIAEKNALDLIDGNGMINKLKFKDLENITELENKDVVEFYNKYIKNIKPKIFINGNIDINRVDKIISKYIKNFDLIDYEIIDKYNYYFNDLNYVSKTDECDFYQSIVFMGYNIKNYTDKDKYKLYLINLLLNSSSSDLLLENLRKQNNLVYSCGSSAFLNNGLLIIKAMTSKLNIKTIQLVIQDLIKKLENIDDYAENVSNIMYRLSLNLEREKDDFFIASSDTINNYFRSDLSSEEELDILSNIEKEELLDVIRRLNLVSVYVMEGNRG